MQVTTARNTFRFQWCKTKYTEDQYELHNEIDAIGDGGEEEMVSSLMMKYKLSDARTRGRTWRDRQKSEAWETVRKLEIRPLETDTAYTAGEWRWKETRKLKLSVV